MELRIPPRLESRGTDEFLPTKIAPQTNELTGASTTKTSNLPYLIARHRKIADNCFRHARSKEHGLKHIDLRRGFLAIFWILVFLLVLAILLSMIADLAQSYAAMPVATQIKSEQETMLFPDVSICTKVPFYASSGANGMNSSLDELLYQTRSAIMSKMVDASVKVTEDGIQGSLLIQMATRQDESVLRAYQHIIYCQYHDQPCSFYNFTEIAHLRYVHCFTFSPNQRVLSGGKGLQFIFYKTDTNAEPFLMLNDLEDVLFTDPVNDGLHIFIHNPHTFPTYAINNMPTSFSVRYGQHATVEVSGLQYQSDKSGRKSCALSKEPYKYTNFRGGANFLEYVYTYEDCIANMKQRHIYKQCRCFSDTLFVPFKGADSMMKAEADPSLFSTEFCRDIRRKTSQRLREDFLCFDQYERMPTTTVLDQFIPINILYETREELDARKIERHKVCPLTCEKMIYSTRFFEIVDINPDMILSPSLLNTYMEQLAASQLENPHLVQEWEQLRNSGNTDTTVQMEALKKEHIVIVDVRLTSELTDVWQEELTETAFNLISNLGGTLGLCAGISFLSSFFLIIFFGRAFFHALYSWVLWFCWSVYLGKPPAAPIKDALPSSTQVTTKYDEDRKSNSESSGTSLKQWTLTDTKLLKPNIGDEKSVDPQGSPPPTFSDESDVNLPDLADDGSLPEDTERSSNESTTTGMNTGMTTGGLYTGTSEAIEKRNLTPSHIRFDGKERNARSRFGMEKASNKPLQSSYAERRHARNTPIENKITQTAKETISPPFESETYKSEGYSKLWIPRARSEKKHRKSQTPSKVPKARSPNATRTTRDVAIQHADTDERMLPLANVQPDFLLDIQFGNDSDDFPSYIYERPPPALERRPLNERQHIYQLPESEQVLPPLVNQELIPHRLRARYARRPPPPYSRR